MLHTLRLLIFGIAFLSFANTAHSDNHKEVFPNTSVSAIDFIENKGQWVSEARFMAEIPGGAVFLTDKGFVYNFANLKDLNMHELSHRNSSGTDIDLNKQIVRHHGYRVNFVGVNPNVTYTADKKRNYYHNYFIGKDSSKWAGKVGLYGIVTQKDIYKGIDVKVYSSTPESIKYDFVVATGCDPKQILLSFEGVAPVLTKEGHIRITTTVNEILETAPYSYQEINGKKVAVKSRYRLDNGNLSFEFPNGYDKQYALIIDPDLIYSTYSGAAALNFGGWATTYDKDGNAYTSSLSVSGLWPVTWGAYQVFYPRTAVFAISKINKNGSGLIFATYYGDTAGVCYVNALRVNDNNELFMCGQVTSPNMPVTSGAYQTSMRGPSDIYVARFSSDGGRLLASTYVGGTRGEATLAIGRSATFLDGGISPNDITFDNEGFPWIISNSKSIDFPVTINAFQNAFGGGDDDGVLFKMSTDLSTILYSTYFGGSDGDGGLSLEYNSKNNFIGVVGYTKSANFPVTSGAYKTTHSGGFDGFALLLDARTYSVVATTYLGTKESDFAMRIDFDCHNNVLVAGRTAGNYPVTNTEAQGLVPTGCVFIDKLTPTLSKSTASTRTGIRDTVGSILTSDGNNEIIVSAMGVDICGNVTVSTITAATLQQRMPLTPDAFQTIPTAFYIATFEPDFSALKFGSYFGIPINIHLHPGISRMDKNGILYQSLCTTEVAFPTTPGSYCPTRLQGSNDNVTVKIDFNILVDGGVITSSSSVSGGGANDTAAHCVRGCKSAFIRYNRTPDSNPAVLKLKLTGNAENGVDYQFVADSLIIPAHQGTAILEIKPLLVSKPMPPDPKYVVVGVRSPCSYCEVLLQDTIWIYDSLYVDISPPDTSCQGDTITIRSVIDPGLNFAWSPVDLIPDVSELTIRPAPDSTTIYNITVFQPGAPSTCPSRRKSYLAYVEPYPNIVLEDISGCPEDSIDVLAQVYPEGISYYYRWSPPDYLRNDYEILNKIAALEGSYKKTLTVSTPGAGCASKDSMLITVWAPFEFDRIFPLDTTINFGDSIYLNSEGEAIIWQWLPTIYLDNPTVKSPLAKPLKSIVYTLLGFDEHGCKAAGEVKIHVAYRPGEWLPNCFSPNGDGLNDMFELVNLRFGKLTKFEIFNRFGQLVFETKNQLVGWNGMVNGIPADIGTYYYHINVLHPNGDVTNFKGDVMLVR